MEIESHFLLIGRLFALENSFYGWFDGKVLNRKKKLRDVWREENKIMGDIKFQ